MHTLMVDVAMTRRKLFCFVMDEHETVLWSGQRLGDALAWLNDQGHDTVHLKTGVKVYDLTFRPPVP